MKLLHKILVHVDFSKASRRVLSNALTITQENEMLLLRRKGDFYSFIRKIDFKSIKFDKQILKKEPFIEIF